MMDSGALSLFSSFFVSILCFVSVLLWVGSRQFVFPCHLWCSHKKESLIIPVVYLVHLISVCSCRSPPCLEKVEMFMVCNLVGRLDLLCLILLDLVKVWIMSNWFHANSLDRMPGLRFILLDCIRDRVLCSVLVNQFRVHRLSHISWMWWQSTTNNLCPPPSRWP